MKRIPLHASIILLILISVVACNHRPKVVSPVAIPNLDSLKTYVDRVNKTNDPQDQLFAGHYYLEQYNHKDSVKGIDLLAKSAAQNNPFAANELGCIYSADSTNTYYNIQKAVEYFELGVKYGYDRAMTNLASLYMDGHGVEPNYEKALHLRTNAILGLLELAEQGDVAAQRRLGYKIAWGEGISRNDIAGFKWIKKAADQGDPYAYALMGSGYANGYGDLEKDDKQAFEYFLKAADNGRPDAMEIIADWYREGKGIDADFEKAFEYDLKAAQLGNSGAMFSTALAYKEGRGTDKDYKEAFKWYQKCADRGNTSAMNNIGAMYSEGLGVAKDEKEAFRWFLKAAEKGDHWSERVVGRCYFYGKGVEADKSKAFDWFLKAARGGDRLGKEWLAFCYRNGEGTPMDIKLADYWKDQAR